MKIQVNSTLLKWTRESLNIPLEDMAKKLNIKQELLSKWETDNSEIPIGKIRDVAHYYKRPLGYFLLKKTPESKSPPADFRVNPEFSDEGLSTPVLLAIRRGRDIQQNIKDIFDKSLLSKKISFRSNLESNPELQANKLRIKFNINLNLLSNFKNDYDAYKSWKDLIEFHLGIMILEFSLPLEEVRALSLNHNSSPLIIINSKDVASARSFSLFHELYHISLGAEGICDLSSNTYQLPFRKRQIETACNAFAAEFLVPKKELLKKSLDLKILENNDFSDISISKLAGIFKVSRPVILRRFLTLEYINESTYKRITERWQEEYKNTQTKQKNKGFSDHTGKTLRGNGRMYTLHVLNAYHNNKLSLRDVGILLNTNIKHINTIESKARNSYGSRTSFI